MNWDKSHVIVAVISAVLSAVAVTLVQFLAYGATYGRLSKSVEDYDKRLSGIEAHLKEVEKPRPKTAKGELCGKLIDGLVDASKDSISGETRQKPLLETAARMDCFEGVPAMATEPEGGWPDEKKP